MITVYDVHIAAPPIGPIQLCAACGHVLQDNTAWDEGRVAIPDGQPDIGPLWWETGRRIGHAGGVTYAIGADRPLEPEEQLCAGAN